MLGLGLGRTLEYRGGCGRSAPETIKLSYACTTGKTSLQKLGIPLLATSRGDTIEPDDRPNTRFAQMLLGSHYIIVGF